jgi:hypothetical protein
MPFKYIIKWHRACPEKVSVEAYYRYPNTEEEKHKPAFTIGKAEGGGLLAIRHILEKAAEKNPKKERGNTISILLNEGDQEAYETAYRVGLATAIIDKAQTTQEIDKGTRYVLNATREEIWFWTSKLLDDEIGAKALEALAVLSGATHLNSTLLQATPTAPPPTEAAPKQPKPRIPQPTTGTFWPAVRQRMKEKAIQLYQKDHPETKTTPEMKELRKTGYLHTAKIIALREIYQEQKTKIKKQTQ